MRLFLSKILKSVPAIVVASLASNLAYAITPHDLGCVNKVCRISIDNLSTNNKPPYSFATYDGNWTPNIKLIDGPDWLPPNTKITIDSDATWDSILSDPDGKAVMINIPHVGYFYMPIRLHKNDEYIFTPSGSEQTWNINGHSTAYVTPNSLGNTIIPTQPVTVYSMSAGNTEQTTYLSDASCANSNCIVPLDGSVVIAHSDQATPNISMIQTLSGAPIIGDGLGLTLTPGSTYVLSYDANLKQWTDITDLTTDAADLKRQKNATKTDGGSSKVDLN